jgi:probable dihydroxyacetone kinase regulator
MDTADSIEERLAKSLKSLAIKEPFEKITIKKITDGAGVIRATFYNHFQDKYDLLEWIIRTEILDPVHILMQNEMFREAVVLIFINMQKDQEFYAHVRHMEGQNSFAEIVEKSITKLLYEILTEHVGRHRSKYSWMTPEYLARYYARAMTFVVLEWIASGMIIQPEEMATMYEYIATRSLKDIVNELE